MAGHSKWANIKHRKERQDKKRGAQWSKCSRAIIAAARAGGGDPDTNLTLRYAIDEAKYANMPKDTIQRAVDKGAGAADGDNYEEVTYEGYGPGGTALVVTALTDNKTRTVADVRNFFKKSGGSLGQSGSVSFSFETKGQIIIDADKTNEEQIMEVAIEAGAEDVEAPDGDGDSWNVTCNPTDFAAVRDAIEAANIEIASAEITKIATNTVDVTGDDVRKLMNLVDNLEEHDDVQKVYTNADIAEEDLAALG
ncbi:MAG: YebC/PmpR family DNA-binding transcriptional regulator [Planctomycetota bacterium]